MGVFEFNRGNSLVIIDDFNLVGVRATANEGEKTEQGIAGSSWLHQFLTEEGAVPRRAKTFTPLTPYF